MRKKILWLTETAGMLALLLALQWATKPAGQLVTGSCVNTVLAISALVIGLSGGLTVAILSPVFAYFLGIAPNLLALPAIMAGNALFVTALKLLDGKQLWKKGIAWLTAAVTKFAAIYVLVAWLICGWNVAAFPAAFSWPQLVTALIGGGIALAIATPIKKAIHRR